MAKPQSKTEKKLDNNLRLALQDVCEQQLKDIDGFQWITHQANYTNFPASLLITCVFDTTVNQQQAEQSGQQEAIAKMIQAKLLKIGIRFKALAKQILLDSEEACEQEHAGSWDDRTASRAGRAVVKKRTS